MHGIRSRIAEARKRAGALIGSAFIVGGICAVASAAGFVASPVVGCSTCGADCVEGQFVYVELSCAHADLTSVRITGVCGSDDANQLVDYMSDSGFASASFGFGSVQSGHCHFDLTFSNGFTYSGDVSFAEQEQGCGCSAYLAPTPSKFTVNNPNSTCVVDGGLE